MKYSYGNRHEAQLLDEGLLAIESCWGEEKSQFFKNVVPVELRTLQGKDARPRIFGQHKLVLCILRNKGHKVVWVAEACIWGE